MKHTVKTSRSAGYLEKIFRQINNDSFSGALEEPIITIQSTAGAYGHVTVGKVWKRGEEERHELNICADWLQRPIENVVATMIHEMVHLYNMAQGVQDCSNGGIYHNRKFKDEAERHMLKIEKHEKYGWTITSPTEELLTYIINQGWDDFEMSRTHPSFWGVSGGKNGGKTGGNTNKGGNAVKPKGSNSRKYVCPNCGAIVRATRDLEIICKPCMEEFILEE